MATDDRSRTSRSMLAGLGNPDDRAAWREAWGRFIDRYGQLIYGWCCQWQLQPADAEDLTQRLLIEIPAKLGTFDYRPERGRFHGWLKVVVRNALNSFVERRPREATLGHDPADVQRAEDDLIDRLDAAFERELLEEAMEQVRPRVKPATWDAFRLTAIDGLPVREVSERLKIPVTHVSVYKGRVQQLLAEEVRKLRGNDDQ
jgi:RNA polymerase sigma-70 factor (ECF subfamily)